MSRTISYKTSADAQMRTSLTALESEIENISKLTKIIGEIPGDHLNFIDATGIIRYLSYKREDYETEIKRRNQATA